jgi:hypothetical protein
VAATEPSRDTPEHWRNRPLQPTCPENRYPKDSCKLPYLPMQRVPCFDLVITQPVSLSDSPCCSHF